MSKFQYVLLGVFGFFIILAVLVFALYRGGASQREATITVWGSFPAYDVNNVVGMVPSLGNDKTLIIRYKEFSAETLEEEFTEALASGTGPDLIIIPQDKLWKNKSKLLPIPYTSVSERDFKATFVEAGELFLSESGIYALPIAVDPMVLYYNRDILSSAGLAKPLAFWDEIYSAALALTKKDDAGNITRSAVALGETRNVKHFKEILALLMLQAGTPITGFFGPDLRSQLSTSLDSTIPGEAAINFYTQFSNPSKPFYSWNRTLNSSDTQFVSGDLAYYLGFASELKTLRAKSPTLNFAVTSLPQSRVSGKNITFGKIYGVAISRTTKNHAAALSAAVKLISKESQAALAQTITLPPARRDLLSLSPTGAFTPVFYDSAIQAKGFIDPDDIGTRKVFQDMIEAVTSGRSRISEALSRGSQELEALINK